VGRARVARVDARFSDRLSFPPRPQTQVPELSAFWLLTILPQLVIVVYMSFAQQSVPVPLDVAVGIPMVAFLLLELRHGFTTVRGFIRKQTSDFYRSVAEEALAKETEARGTARRALGQTYAYTALPRGGGGGGGGGGGSLDLDGAMATVGARTIAAEGARALAAGVGLGATTDGTAVARDLAAQMGAREPKVD
jgi:hypothetical protein